jgi:polyphosphate kinase
VELVIPVEDRKLKEKLWEILQIMLNDERQAWEMRPDGAYAQRQPPSPEHVGTHETLMALTAKRYAEYR